MKRGLGEYKKPDLCGDTQKRRGTIIGHILRHENIIRIIVGGAIEGRNRRGRSKISYM